MKEQNSGAHEAELIELAQAVLEWAEEPRDNGGNPYQLKFVKLAQGIIKANNDN